MIERNEYFNLKREIKTLSYNNILKLYEEMQLDDEERKLLDNFYRNKSRVQTCMEIGMSFDTYTKHMKLLFTKINNYKNTLK